MSGSSNSARTERRARTRTPVVLAVGLSSSAKSNRHGVTRDLSSRGLLIVTPSAFAKGERLSITVHAAGGASTQVSGRIARIEQNAISSPEIWRYRMGIELDDVLPDALIEHGARASSRAG